MTEPDAHAADLTKTTNADSEEIREKAADAVRMLPPDQAELVHQITTTMMMQGPMPNPVLQKVTEEHVGQALTMAAEHDSRAFDIETRRQNRLDSNRWFLLAVFAIILVAIAGACWGFHDKPEILAPLLTGVIGLGSGFLAGMGVGRAQATSN